MFNGVAVITCGSSGIGLTLAARLVQNGASIALCGPQPAPDPAYWAPDVTVI